MAGVALGVAASLFMQSKRGQELKNEVEGYIAEFYMEVSPKIEKIKKMSKKEYEDFMDTALDNYAKAKDLSESIIHDMKEQIGKSWDHFASYMKAEVE